MPAPRGLALAMALGPGLVWCGEFIGPGEVMGKHCWSTAAFLQAPQRRRRKKSPVASPTSAVIFVSG